MAYEIGFGYTSGATLTYGAYRPDGVVRTAAGTSIAEIGSTGYYVASDAAIQKGDLIIVKESTAVVLSAKYVPTFSVPDLCVGLRGGDKVEFAGFIGAWRPTGIYNSQIYYTTATESCFLYYSQHRFIWEMCDEFDPSDGEKPLWSSDNLFGEYATAGVNRASNPAYVGEQLPYIRCTGTLVPQAQGVYYHSTYDDIDGAGYAPKFTRMDGAGTLSWNSDGDDWFLQFFIGEDIYSWSKDGTETEYLGEYAANPGNSEGTPLFSAIPEGVFNQRLEPLVEEPVLNVFNGGTKLI